MVKIIDLHFEGHTGTIATFLIETKDGPILVETGPHSTLQHLAVGLGKEGYTIEDVRHVFLTHIHLDHGGAAWVFAEKGANIYLHPFGIRHYNDPTKLLDSARQIYKDEMDKLWGELQPIPLERLRAVSPNQIVTVGNVKMQALFTPGHAVHHIAWKSGKALFTGDAAGICIQNQIVVPPCPPPDINLEHWMDSIKLMQSKRINELYLTHFGKVESVREHFEELKGRLRNWANWLKPYWENNISVEEVTPLFNNYIASQLKSAGVKGEDLIRYELANPGFMSVMGLYRYWKKKMAE
jgi:glyoxylase-like metal-dependent hydrolase (beta-lactamase superfamily II)